MTKKTIALLTSGALLGSTLLTGAALAAPGTTTTNTHLKNHSFIGGAPRQKPAVVGSVTTVNGNVLTVTDKSGTVFTVDAGSAKITKGFGASSTTLLITDVKVGDTVAVTGTTSGNAVAATAIVDGIGMGMMHGTPPVFGTVTTVSGNTLTITSPGGTIYTIDATNAKITKGFGPAATTITISGIAVGDTVGAVGTVSGTAVTATAIMDGVGGMPGRGMGMMHQKGVGGTVASVNGTSFTVTQPNDNDADDVAGQTNTFTVNTSGTTTFTKDGAAGSISDVVVGAHVMADGTVDAANKIVTATSINISTKAPTGMRGRGGMHMMGGWNK